MKVRGVRGDKEIGVTSLAFSHEDPETFLVGSESGCIFRCSMNAKGSPAGSEWWMCFILQYCYTWGGGGSEVSGGCVSSCSTAIHGGRGGGGLK